jgi:hypothetical protein
MVVVVIVGFGHGQSVSQSISNHRTCLGDVEGRAQLLELAGRLRVLGLELLAVAAVVLFVVWGEGWVNQSVSQSNQSASLWNSGVLFGPAGGQARGPTASKAKQ